MSDPEIDALVREARARRHADEFGPCGICGGTGWLLETAHGTRCYEHRLGPDAIVERDHAAGAANLPSLTVALRGNVHRRATEIRLALGTNGWPNANGDPILEAAHLIAGLLSYLALIVEWLVALDAFLRERFGDVWFKDAPPFPFA